ncbi:1,3-beta-glucan synthase subunit FKS1-like, domain-1 [Artemisia annua]|uniref:1,3-beta-glucan synthase subunit FKS1-like, domain-1 n=1 Tax=Artemisia annua TaxID=35608 RepID=A0A2U1LP33_ARTAN|nr:1,3-beta-glucan synthase subunit FKS1-like, domain-1 [Artemisia annua]
MVVVVYCANITWLATDPAPNMTREGFFVISFALPFSFEDFSGEPNTPIHTADVEIRGAISALRYHKQFPMLPFDFEVPAHHSLDRFDLLEFVFGF